MIKYSKQIKQALFLFTARFIGMVRRIGSTNDKLLNPIQYYVGDWGIGDAATSLLHLTSDYFA